MSTIHKNYPAVLGISYSVSPTDLLNITNQVRKQNNLAPLQLDSELTQAATNKAADMFSKNYWAHIAPDGVTPWVFIKNSGYDYLYAGENLARGYTTAQDVVSAWMASPSHRENMLSHNYNNVGFAIATGSLTGNDTVLVVEELGSRYNANSEAGLAPETTVIVADTPAPPLPKPTTTSMTSTSQNISNDTPQKQLAVASIQQQPLIDKNNFTQNLLIAVIIFFVVALVLDAIIITRKKIIRAVSHNFDHITFLLIILLSILIIGRGLVL